MTRITALSDERLASLASLSSEIRSQRQGRMPLLYRVLANSPPVAQGWLAFFTALRQRSTLSKRTLELAILRVTQMFDAKHEFDSHVPFALQSGMDADLISKLASWRTCDAFGPEDRQVLAYVEEVSRAEVRDESFAALAATLSEQEMLELTVTIAAYGMVSRVGSALRITPPEK